VWQGLLECLDVPYVGRGVLSSALCMDKVLFKDLMGASGIPQVDYVGVQEARWREDRQGVLKKPLRSGCRPSSSRLGSGRPSAIEGVGHERAAPARWMPRSSTDSLAIVEAMCAGAFREVECSVMGTSEPIGRRPGEITYANEWYDYDASTPEGGMELVVPARIDERPTGCASASWPWRSSGAPAAAAWRGPTSSSHATGCSSTS